MPASLERRLPLSCFIIAVNEADRIAPVIESVVGWVDEVVVIDSGSTDGTQDLAEKLGARVIHHAWPGFGPQKRYGEDQCRNDWVLNLDADEVMSEELIREIIALFAEGPAGASVLPVPAQAGLSRRHQAAALGGLPQLRSPLRSPGGPFRRQPRA